MENFFCHGSLVRFMVVMVGGMVVGGGGHLVVHGSNLKEIEVV